MAIVRRALEGATRLGRARAIAAGFDADEAALGVLDEDPGQMPTGLDGLALLGELRLDDVVCLVAMSQSSGRSSSLLLILSFFLDGNSKLCSPCSSNRFDVSDIVDREG